jgi:hypothetical protein
MTIGDARIFYGEASGCFGEAAQAFAAAERAAGEAVAGQDGVTQTAESLVVTANETTNYAPAIGAASLKHVRWVMAETADRDLRSAVGLDPRGRRREVAERIEALLERQLKLVDDLSGAVDLAEELLGICSQIRDTSESRSATLRRAQSGLQGVAVQSATISEEAGRAAQSL